MSSKDHVHPHVAMVTEKHCHAWISDVDGYMASVLFAFDFIVENVCELRESDNVHAVEFKLLDFPTVSVALGPRKTREQRSRTFHHAEGTSKPRTAAQRADSNKSVRKGKSVTFRIHPTELFRNLRMAPLKVRLQRSSATENPTTDEELKLGATLPDEGVLDLSEMLATMEALVASENLYKKEKSTIKCSTKDSITIKNDASTKLTKLHVKVRLVCFRDEERNMPSEIPERVFENREGTHVADHEERQHLPSPEKAEEQMSLKTPSPHLSVAKPHSPLDVGHIDVDDRDGRRRGSVLVEEQDHPSSENHEKTEERMVPSSSEVKSQSANFDVDHVDDRDGRNRECVSAEEQDHPSLENAEKTEDGMPLTSPLSEPKPESTNLDVGLVVVVGDNVSSKCTESDQNEGSARIVHEDNCNTNSIPMYDASGPKSSTTTIDSHTSSSENTEVYIPNSMCPPPLFYHSQQDNLHTQHTVSCWKPLPMSTAGPLSTDEVWCESVAQTDGYSDWSVLAQYDHTSNPITTQLKRQKKCDKVVHTRVADNSDIVRNLPLLSVLMEEISYLNSQLSNRTVEKKEPKTVSTSSQTEKSLKPETKLVRQEKVRQHVRKGGGRGGGFVRQCCKAVTSRKKLIPSNKSILYAPDIVHKQRAFLSQKKSKSVKFADSPPRKPADHKKQRKTICDQPKSCTDAKSFAGSSNSESVQPVNPNPTVKLDVHVSTTSHDQSPTLLSSPPSMSSASPPTMVRREMRRVNAETQTEEIEKDEQKATTAREQSVQTECEEVRNETWKDEADTSSRGGVTPAPSSTPTHTQSIEAATRTLSPQPSLIVLPAEVEERNLPHQSLTSSPRLPLLETSSRLQERRQSDGAQSLPKFRSSRQQFSSMRDIRTALPESPLLHSTTLHTDPDTVLKSAESQTFDSFLSTTDLVGAVEERGVLPLLSKHHQEGIVFLATSQCSLPSYRGNGGQCDETEELGVGASTEMVEDDGEDDYSDDFEDSDHDSLEDSSSD